MKALKETRGKWNSQQVKQFAEQLLGKYGNGWQMLSRTAKEQAVMGQVGFILMGQYDESSFSPEDIRGLWQDVMTQLGLTVE